MKHKTLVALLSGSIVNTVIATSFSDYAVLLDNTTLLHSQPFSEYFYQATDNMMTLIEERHSWHPGELAIHKMLKVPTRDNPTAPGLPPKYGNWISTFPLIAFSTLDQKGRPWSTVWGGEAGFSRPIAQNTLGARSMADVQFDPVLHELFAIGEGEEGEREIKDEEVIRPDGGRIISALAMNPETRSRVKFAGRFLAGSVTKTESGVGDLQMAVQVEESLGQCPKYISKKKITPSIPNPQLVGQGTRGLPLPAEAVELIGKADLMFISSKHSHGKKLSMDTNNRGGPPGFVRVFRNEGTENGGVTLVYPEYSGNRLYQTLGNLQEDPYLGMVIPDFDTGNVFYATGRTTILVGDKAAAYLPHIKIAIKFDVDEARFVKNGLPLRGKQIEFSPYNPPVRRLVSEQDRGAPDVGTAAIATATLLKREVITPTISQFTFRLRRAEDNRGVKGPLLKVWQPGQNITLDFSSQLDQGYSHMRDDDPQSLNDDFVRTFTISSSPPLDLAIIDQEGHIGAEMEPQVQVTMRKNGPATGLLWRWNLRAPLDLDVLTFGDDEAFRLPVSAGALGEGNKERSSVFIAGGVGITPLMAQAREIFNGGHSAGTGLLLLWTLRGEDLPLAVKVLGEIQGLGEVTKLFVTGTVVDETEENQLLSKLQSLGAVVERRRIRQDDVFAAGESGQRKYYVCTGTDLMKTLQKWTEGEDMVSESFAY